MIEKYQLFDFNLKPSHINLISQVEGDNTRNSITGTRNIVNNNSHILAQDGFDELNQIDVLNSAQNSVRHPDSN